MITQLNTSELDLSNHTLIEDYELFICKKCGKKFKVAYTKSKKFKNLLPNKEHGCQHSIISISEFIKILKNMYQYKYSQQDLAKFIEYFSRK